MSSKKDQSRKRKLKLDSHDEASQAPKRANTDPILQKESEKSNRECQVLPNTPASSPEVRSWRAIDGFGGGGGLL